MRSAAELMRAYYEALNEPNLDALEGLFHPDAEWRFPGSTLHGGAPVRIVMQRSLSTGLRMHHVIRHMVEQANVALVPERPRSRFGRAGVTAFMLSVRPVSAVRRRLRRLAAG